MTALSTELQSRARWLIVFDNVEDPAALAAPRLSSSPCCSRMVGWAVALEGACGLRLAAAEGAGMP